MQLSAGFVSLSLALVGMMVLAAPINTGTILVNTLAAVQTDVTINPIVGAAYFMTNEPDGNFIMAADIQQDGTLKMNRAVSTAGRGSRGKNGDSNGPDALFSQGSVKASANGKMLVAVNAGSHTVSAFSIKPDDPSSIDMLGGPVASGGEFPVSLAVNKAGDRVCVLNSGAVAGVNCFSVSNTTGLAAIPGTLRALDLKQTTPPQGPPVTASQLLFNDAEDKLMATVKGNDSSTQGFLAVWDIDKNSTLSEKFAKITPSDKGSLPFGMALVPGKNAAIVADPSAGFDVFDLSNVKDGDKLPGNYSVTKIDGQSAVCWVVHSEKTNNFYLTDVATSKITEVSLDNNLKPSIVKQYNQTANSGIVDLDVAKVGDKNFLYVLAANNTQVQVLSLNNPGDANGVQGLDLAPLAKQAGLKLGTNIQGMATFMKP